ncbi:MAG: hypothetical protein ACYDIC_05600 [Desulfobaccales bacterium]
MKKLAVIIAILVFFLVGLAQVQAAETTMKEMYLTVAKYAKFINGPHQFNSDEALEFDKTMANVEAEFDLFKDGKVAKANPQFTYNLATAIKNLAMVGYIMFHEGMNKENNEKVDAGKKTVEGELKAAKQNLLKQTQAEAKKKHAQQEKREAQRKVEKIQDRLNNIYDKEVFGK